jgi:hypothetical protein
VATTAQTKIVDPEALGELLAHLDEHLNLEPGQECPGCHRVVPKKKSDDQPGPVRNVVSVHEPKGEGGTLEALMVQVVDKYREQWPLDYASMRDGIGLEVVGGRSWKYHVLHFALYAVLMVPGLEPTE